MTIEKQVVVGIDLGTTNSLIAYIDQGKPVIVPGGFVPSIVKLTKEFERPIIGAESLGRDRAFRSIKRLMGKGLADIEKIQGNLHFDIDYAVSGPGIVMIQGDDGHSYDPVSVSSMILQHLKEIAERELKAQVKQAIITVPAHFDEAARMATRKAGALAGLEVIRLLNEPTAAAVAYGLHRRYQEGKEENAKPILVYDMGGGTFDVSILKMREGVLKVIATGGESFLGGDDFDYALADLALRKQGLNWDLIESRGLVHQWLREAKDYKEKIEAREKWSSSIEEAKNDIIISLEEAEEAWQPLMEKARVVVQEVLERAKLRPEDLDEVVLVGGATRLRIIQKELEAFFGKSPICDINPDEVVALGAALQAEAITGGSGGEIGYDLLLDVVPLGLGIEVMGGGVERIIERDEAIPATTTRLFTTYCDNQQGFIIHVLQGEGERVDQCRSLAILELKGIPPMPAGEAILEVKFCVDADGLLTVMAHERTSGISQEVEVRPSYGLTDEAIIKLLRANSSIT